MAVMIGDTAPNFEFPACGENNQDFYTLTDGFSSVLIFLRYYGCPVCRMEMDRFREEMDTFGEERVRVFAFLQSDESVINMSGKIDSQYPFKIVFDPEGAIYRLYHVYPGGIFKYLHPAGLAAGIRAMSKGYGHGKFEGKETQVPAAFVVSPEKIVKYAYYGKNIGDLPPPAVLTEHL